ncbi:hypothetical protein [Shewanella baltica]|uniref:hypothetical protein n=1 Tax=Shewanella baltica TaxID=62322 RepID=UPI003D7BD6FA
MTRKKESLAIDKIFEEISDFLIIGLTGRTGSGCSTSAKILSAESLDLPDPGQSHFVGNEQRKYRIIKKYIESNRKPFEWLQVRKIITSYILKLNFSSFCMLVSDILNVELSLVSENLADFKSEYIKSSDRVNSYFETDVNTVESLNAGKLECYDIFFKWLPGFSNELKSRLLGIQSGGYTKIYQVVGDNIRSSGTANIKEFNQKFIFSFPTMINRIIKSARYVCSMDAKPCNIVVDAIRNPYEAVYLRDRYSGFYLMSVNTDNDNRLKYLMESHKFTSSQIKELDRLCFLNRVSEQNSHHCSNIKLHSGFQAYLAQ